MQEGGRGPDGAGRPPRVGHGKAGGAGPVAVSLCVPGALCMLRKELAMFSGDDRNAGRCRCGSKTTSWRDCKEPHGSDVGTATSAEEGALEGQREGPFAPVAAVANRHEPGTRKGAHLRPAVQDVTIRTSAFPGWRR